MSSEADPSLASDEDRRILARAVELGRRGWGRVHPNPMVGCVLVREGEVVGEGWHEEYGRSHAEVVALRAAGDRARGATAFVSLEPCRHEGKTPPCTRALLAAGIARVVYGAADPGRDSGGGGRELAAAGVEVRGPLFSAMEAARENPGFYHDRTDRPWIALKLALSLDGRISEAAGKRTLLSGSLATGEVHRLRAGFDAILVGARTALVDDPALTVRGKVTPRIPPRRIVLDSRGRVPANGRLFREPGGEVLVLTTGSSAPTWREAIVEGGARVELLSADGAGRVELSAALRFLSGEGIRTLLCEGGGVLGAALLSAGVVDRLHLLLAPSFLGDHGVPAFPGVEGLPIARHWSHIDAPRLLGEDLWVTLERTATI